MKNRNLILGLIVGVLVIIGIVLLWVSNDYSVDLSQIKVHEDSTGTIKTEPVYKIEFTGYIINIIGQFLITLGASIFIAVFVLESLSKADKKAFEEKILSFQKDTAKDAISSVFDTLIPKEFLELLNKDILGAKVVRKNVTWNYFVDNEESKLKLRRLISYELTNLSNSEQPEEIRITTGNNKHSETKLGENNYYEINGEKKTLELEVSCIGDGFERHIQSLKIKPNSTIKIHFEIIQIFNTDYVYETHSTRHSIMDLTINVKVPQNYKFDISPSLSSELNCNDNDDFKIFKSEGAIYKGQGIEFYCERK